MTDQAWIEEAKRRLAAYERGEITALDFDQSMCELEAKARRRRERRVQVERAWIAEAKRRSSAIERGEMALVDSEELMARLRARIRRGPK